MRLIDDDLEIDLASANAPGNRMALVAITPLTTGEPWVAFAPGELRVFVAGRSVWHTSTAPQAAGVAAVA